MFYISKGEVGGGGISCKNGSSRNGAIQNYTY